MLTEFGIRYRLESCDPIPQSKAKGNRPVFELGSGNGETDSPSWSSVNKMKDMFEFGEGSNTRPQTQINSPEIKSIHVPEAFKKCKSENTGI